MIFVSVVNQSRGLVVVYNDPPVLPRKQYNTCINGILVILFCNLFGISRENHRHISHKGM